MNSNFKLRPSLGWVIALAVVVTSSIVTNLSAQDEAEGETAKADTQNEKKVIREPVHRVPLVATNLPPHTNVKPLRSKSTVNDAAAEFIEPNEAPSVLPTTSKPVPVPTDPSPTPVPVPVQPASSKKIIKHPLDDALASAERGLVHMRSNVKDYSAILIKRERVDGKLLKPEYMQVKIRSERTTETGQHIPFSIYMKFIKPKACAGREVIWVKGKNRNQICVHEGSGITSLRTFNLDPDSWIAMKGQRYPIYEAGMENLIVKLIEKAERDRAAGHCDVKYKDGVKINGRPCEVIEVTHPVACAPYDFNIAKVYIDKELKMPVRYQAHIWPRPGSTKPQLLEEYTYLNIKVNQGFTDEDFNPKNPVYNFPK